MEKMCFSTPPKETDSLEPGVGEPTLFGSNLSAFKLLLPKSNISPENDGWKLEDEFPWISF